MIDDEQLAFWLESYRSDELNEDQREELRELIEHDRAFRTAFCRALADASRLEVYLSGENLEHHQACINDAITMMRSSQRIREVQRVTSNKPRRSSRRTRVVRTRRKQSSNVIPLLFTAAAALIIAILIFNLPTEQVDPLPVQPEPIIVQATPPQNAQPNPWSIATIHQINGNAQIDGKQLRTGQSAPAFGRLSATGMTDISLSDGTRFQTYGPSELAITDQGPLILTQGSLEIDVAEQDEQTFTISGPSGQVRVVGTRFAMHTQGKETIIALSQGRIDTNIGAHSQSWAAPSHIRMDGVVSEALSDYIEIKAGQGTITDPQWRLATDNDASSGKAWVLAPQSDSLWEDARGTHQALNKERGIDIMVPALAGMRYHCWIRYRCDEIGDVKQRLKHDTIALKFVDGQIISRPHTPKERLFKEGPKLASFSGAALADGYVWVGGWADRGLDTQSEAVTVEFQRSGLQRLRILTYEGPLRIDSIRLVPENGEQPIR